MSGKTNNSKYIGDCSFGGLPKKLLMCIKNQTLKIR